MTIYVVKQGRGERRCVGHDDYEGEIFRDEWDVKVFDCRAKTLEYIFNAINAEIEQLERCGTDHYIRRLTREELEKCRHGQYIRYAARLVYDLVNEEEYFMYSEYEVE